MENCQYSNPQISVNKSSFDLAQNLHSVQNKSKQTLNHAKRFEYMLIVVKWRQRSICCYF